MRYYPAVGPAIPHKRAGCSRVTHPFAGHSRKSALDLHVLSTPPAFVLRQDQTLQENLHSSTNTEPKCEPRFMSMNLVYSSPHRARARWIYESLVTSLPSIVKQLTLFRGTPTERVQGRRGIIAPWAPRS